MAFGTRARFASHPGVGFGRTGSVDQRRSEALVDAAQNPLERALRLRLDGDEDGAASAVRRAPALPFDDREESHPAAMAIGLILGHVVEDARRATGDERDHAWAIEALHLADHLDGFARWQWVQAPEAVSHAQPLRNRVHDRIQAAAKPIRDDWTLRELPNDATSSASSARSRGSPACGDSRRPSTSGPAVRARLRVMS